MFEIDKRMNEPSRRAFLSGAAKTLLGVGTLPVLESLAAAGSTSPAASAQSVIYLYMSGGMSHLDSFDPKPGAATQGPVKAIRATADGVLVSEYFPRMAQQMDKVAVINSVNSTQGAHEQGRYFMHTSYFLRGTISHPHLGAYSSLLLDRLNPMLPANVKIGGNSSGLGAGFLESKHAALPIGNPESGLQYSTLPADISQDQFLRRLAHVRQMNSRFQKKLDNKQVRAYSAFYEDAVKLMKSDDLKAFDITLESEATRQRYGSDPFGQGCLLARRLVEHNVRFVEVDYGGWDTHTDNFGRMAEQGAVLDQALAALLEDLSDSRLLEKTLVVLATEFGGTPDITQRDKGRNHYPKAFTCLLAGGGVRGGIKYGRTDDEGREVVADRVTVPDFNATIAHALGLPLDKEIISPSRRPFQVAAEGRPIAGLFL